MHWVAAALLALPVLVLVGFRTAAGLRETATAADLAPKHGQFVSTRSGRMFLQQKGPQDGKPVVLIHGTGAWSELWRPVIDHLAGLGFRVVALDMPPFGFSDRPQPPDYSRTGQAGRIVDALAALGIDGAYLVGHSFGAGPTVETVLRHPDKVRGLVLVAGALGISAGPASDPSGAAAWVLDQRWLMNPLVSATGTNPLLTRQLLSMMIHRKDKADAQAVAILQRPMTLQHSTRDMGVWLKGFLSADRAALSADRGRYADIKVRTADLGRPRHADPARPGARHQRPDRRIGADRLARHRPHPPGRGPSGVRRNPGEGVAADEPIDRPGAGSPADAGCKASRLRAHYADLLFLLVPITPMQDEYFEWDDAKAAANLNKHKISFRAASRVLDDPFAVIEQDITEDYSEDRFIATGLVEGLLITVAYTERGERIRIISARKANGHEQKSYNRG